MPDMPSRCRLADWSALSARLVDALTRHFKGVRPLGAHHDAGAILEAIDRYLEVNGHQVYALDFAEPTLAEDPAEMVTTLKTMVANPDHEPAQHEAVAKQKRDQAYEDIKQVLDGAAYWQFRFRVWFARRYYELREESTFYLSFGWPVFRSMAAELGRRLVAVGALASADDLPPEDCRTRAGDCRPGRR